MSAHPTRRTADLIVRELDNETLVLDTTTDQVHYLTADAAAVWALCDGRTDTDHLAGATGLKEAVVTNALAQLDASGLLVTSGVSRRRMLQVATLGGAALVTTAVMPAASAAASGTGGSGGAATPLVVVSKFDSPTGYGLCGLTITATGFPANQAVALRITSSTNGAPIENDPKGASAAQNATPSTTDAIGNAVFTRSDTYFSNFTGGIATARVTAGGVSAATDFFINANC